MGSEDYATGNPSGEDGSSLAARRARLRGTLAKQAAPPDPYKPDPYLLAPAPSDPDVAPTPAAPANEPTTTTNESTSTETSASDGQPSGSESEPVVPSNEPVAPHFETIAPVNQTPALADEIAASDFEIAALASEFNSPAEEQAAPASAAAPSRGGAGNGNGSTNTLSSASFFAAMTPEPVARPEETFFSQPEVEPVAESESETIAAEPSTGRVDRRRHMSAPATMPPGLLQNLSNSIAEPTNSSTPDSTLSNADSIVDLSYMMPTAPADPMQSIAPMPPNPVAEDDMPLSMSGGYVYGIQQDPNIGQAPTQLQTQAIEIMNNIDQAMGACAMNLSELQKIATEQTDALKGVAQTLQNQSFFEIGLNLNSLMESLSAALEPMKAVGELVPAIDQLVAVMESREASSGGSEEPSKLSREQLITSLADQLSAGIIDPWTFKCAYMAVFPADHPADLLHRLVDLLGTQRLSGDLFRAAYDAVQAPDPPQRAAQQHSEDGEPRTIVKMVQDETIVAQLDELKRTNDEFSKRNEEIQRKLEQKDQEFNQVLAAKEQELQEAQELLNSRWEEFNIRYDELTETLHKRDEVLQEREAELARKESENNQLRTQMEELRDQTKDMVTDLQRQLSAKPKEEAHKQPGFFDVAPGTQQNPQQQAQPQQQGQLFDAGPARPLFGQTEQQQQPTNPLDQLNPQVQQSQPQQNLNQPQQQQQQQPLQQPMQQQQPAQQQQGNQAVPRPAAPTTPFVSGAGSYGSGVRAQVFEVIVRQALAGAPWREICAGPMQVNNISPEEVEAEVKRRQALLKK